MNFSFELDCNHAPMTLVVQVDYAAYYRTADYNNPEEFSADYKYRMFCGDVDVTDAINHSNNRKLQDEIDSAVNANVTNHYFEI
jgi:hypothetical protein